MAPEPLYTNYVPIEDDKQVTCWVKHCVTPAAWIVNLSHPILGAPILALCDAHLYDFETSTVELPG